MRLRGFREFGPLLEFDFESSVGYWICMTSHAFRCTMAQELSAVNLTVRQFEVLGCLACKPGMSQTEMADRMGIEPPTLAGVINRMARDGWLERRPCPDDRRKNRIHPTQQAEDIWKKTTELCHKIREEAVAGIPPEHIDILKSVCQQMRINLEQAEQDDDTAPRLATPNVDGDRPSEGLVSKSEVV